jgi:hypothetical protein
LIISRFEGILGCKRRLVDNNCAIYLNGKKQKNRRFESNPKKAILILAESNKRQSLPA